jgi:hypothetical protein
MHGSMTHVTRLLGGDRGHDLVDGVTKRKSMRHLVLYRPPAWHSHFAWTRPPLSPCGSEGLARSKITSPVGANPTFLGAQPGKKSKSETTPHPRGASASASPKERKEGRQRRATWEEGGNERGRKQLCTRPAASTRSPAGSAASATEGPTNRTSALHLGETKNHKAIINKDPFNEVTAHQISFKLQLCRHCHPPFRLQWLLGPFYLLSPLYL